jgi:hypothetical protein
LVSFGTFGAWRQVIPVISQPVVPRIEPPHTPEPVVGLLWGKISSFQFGEQTTQEDNNNQVIVKLPTSHYYPSALEDLGSAVHWIEQGYQSQQIEKGEFLSEHGADAAIWNDFVAGDTYTGRVDKSIWINRSYIPQATYKFGDETLYEIVGVKADGTYIRQPHKISWYLQLNVNRNIPGPDYAFREEHGSIPPPPPPE